MLRILKVAVLVSCVLIGWNCDKMNDPTGPEIKDSSAPTAASELDTLILVSRSEQSPSLLEMPVASLPASQSDTLNGSWEETTDSLGLKTVFKGAATVPGGSVITTDTAMIRSFDFCIPSESVKMIPITGTTVDQSQAGLLTAGEWNDHLNWRDFQKYVRSNPDAFSRWQLNLQKRILIEVKNRSGNVVPDAEVKISAAGKVVFEGKTLADGRVAFFPLDVLKAETGNYCVSVTKSGLCITSQFKPLDDDDQVWTINLSTCPHNEKPSLDLVFAVDVTGSMSDELSFVQTELVDICKQVYSSGIRNLRVGFVFYRDRGDEFVTRVMNFSNNFEDAQERIKSVKAFGGGDKEESVNFAMRQVFQKLDWQSSSCVRLCFWICDAAPHYYQDECYTYHNGLIDAVKKGIKIIPVAGSGMQSDEEYLFRNVAVKTMGRYIFLTDDSGIGESHLTPAVGSFDVKSLNKLVVQVINDELAKWPGE